MIARTLHRQRGVAVVTALLLTTLAITIVASLFWQQQVQVRSIENQRLQLQKQWILRGALDWTRLILRADKLISRNIDHLGEPWAVPLAETRLEQYVDEVQASEVPDATLSGSIADAQARFNLGNLCQGGQIAPMEVAVFSRLLGLLQLNPELAQAVATAMQNAQRPQSTGASNSTSQPMNLTHVDDLLAVPGFTPEIVEKLKDFVVVLPGTNKKAVNANTAPAEVLAARIDTLSLPEAQALVAERENAWFKDAGDLQNRMQGRELGSGDGMVAFGSDYFLVNGHVRLNRAGMDMQALVDRSNANSNLIKIVWVREY
ncbi:MAG TPA: type II secretion system minor pseudopilin GspK [Noviherbaspirillum sp.]|nr:type II secretion system minor pseudopilin GspK [Noviherbaspirillum sp.]